MHFLKIVRILSFFGPYFLTFGVHIERYRVSLRIQSEYGKIRTRKTPNTNNFHAVVKFSPFFTIVAYVTKFLHCYKK